MSARCGTPEWSAGATAVAVAMLHARDDVAHVAGVSRLSSSVARRTFARGAAHPSDDSRSRVLFS
jgi:hypothetical protein